MDGFESGVKQAGAAQNAVFVSVAPLASLSGVQNPRGKNVSDGPLPSFLSVRVGQMIE